MHLRGWSSLGFLKSEIDSSMTTIKKMLKTSHVKHSLMNAGQSAEKMRHRRLRWYAECHCHTLSERILDRERLENWKLEVIEFNRIEAYTYENAPSKTLNVRECSPASPTAKHWTVSLTQLHTHPRQVPCQTLGIFEAQGKFRQPGGHAYL